MVVADWDTGGTRSWRASWIVIPLIIVGHLLFDLVGGFFLEHDRRGYCVSFAYYPVFGSKH